MDRDRLKEFRARFGITNGPAEFVQFRTRILHAARKSLNLLLENDRDALEAEFAFRNGSHFASSRHRAFTGVSPHGVAEELEQATSFPQLIERIQHVLWTFEALGYFKEKTRYGDRDYSGLQFAASLGEALDLSPGVDLRLILESGRAELAPAGVPILDSQVDSATQWLARYPDVQKEFRQALSILADKKRSQFRQAQDSLRFGLEKLLKLLLNNALRLEDQGRPLKEWLSDKGVHENLRDVAVQIMVLLSKQYQNAAVKHDSNIAQGAEKSWQEFEVEYMIYQHATLFRLLDEAEKSVESGKDNTAPV
jgi:hypothetical protein